LFNEVNGVNNLGFRGFSMCSKSNLSELLKHLKPVKYFVDAINRAGTKFSSEFSSKVGNIMCNDIIDRYYMFAPFDSN